MSHFTVGVLIPGDTPIESTAVDAAVATRIAAYDESLAVEPYRVYLDDEAIVRMATHYEMNLTDLHALARKMDDWSGVPGAVDDKGLYRITTYNPLSKWDWWVIGGRWSGKLFGHERDDDEESVAANVRPVRELPSDLSLFALVTPDGSWHESGRMGWWAMVSEEKDPDRWDAERTELLSAYPDHLLVLLDCHI